jgi:glucosamine 6-phosphate synthetase-like amidotransferase/phosphosugar isomerase protein
MCGIAGLFSFKNLENKEEVRTIIKKMLIDIEARGKDATGISFINSEKNKVFVYKKNIEASKFVNSENFNALFSLLQDYNIILLHTRYKTQGNAENNLNNHPHYNKIFNNVLVHNGIIHNYEELIKEFNLKLDSECDSEVILSLFNKFKEKNKNIEKTINELRGYLAFALYDNKKLYLYKDMNPLFLCYNRTREMFLFSSHADIFSELFKTEIRTAYKIFQFEKPREDYTITELESENLVTIDFKKKKIKLKEDVLTKGYTSIGWSSNANIIKKIEEKTQENAQEEIRKLSSEEVSEGLGYLEAIAEEERENAEDYKTKMRYEKYKNANNHKLSVFNLHKDSLYYDNCII